MSRAELRVGSVERLIEEAGGREQQHGKHNCSSRPSLSWRLTHPCARKQRLNGAECHDPTHALRQQSKG